MARRVTLSQFKSIVRQHQQKVNREIAKLNQAQKRAVSELNAIARKANAEKARRRQAYLTAVSQYNRAVAAHNSKVRLDRSRASSMKAQLRSTSSSAFANIRLTTIEMVDRFDRVQSEPVKSAEHAGIRRLAEVEVDNSLSVAGELFDLDDHASDGGAEEEPTGILDYLEGLSEDLVARWRGAVFAMNPANPDAARHFCTSAREIFTEILEEWASDDEVLAANPTCQMTPNGSKPTRRAKIEYLLSRKGADTPEMVGFVEADINNVIGLFGELNSATHGAAGKFEFRKLQAIRKRVEGGIMFLAAIAA